MRVGRVATEGDELYYEVRGSGPPLLLIHGGVIDASGFSRAADLLAADSTVITYDRRAYSRSTGREPRNFSIEQQARDAVAVLRAAGHEAARIVGSSGGAIIGLELARAQPRAVTSLVAHEPPAMRVLPDASAWLAEYAKVYLAACLEGPRQAMPMFHALNPVPRAEGVAAPSGEERERLRGNIACFLLDEMIPFSRYLPDSAAIRGNGVRVIMGVGEQSREQSPGRTAPILAAQLACPLLTFPGHHLAYIDQAEAWVAVLREALGDA